MAEPTGELIHVFKKPVNDELKWLLVLVSVGVISWILIELIRQTGDYYEASLLRTVYIFFWTAVITSGIMSIYWCLRMLFIVDYATTELYNDGLRIFHGFSFAVSWLQRRKQESYLWTEIVNFDYSEFDWSPPAHVPGNMPQFHFLEFFGSFFRWRSVILEVALQPADHVIPWLRRIIDTRKVRLHVKNSEIQRFIEALSELALPVWQEQVLRNLTEGKVVKFGVGITATKDHMFVAGNLFHSAYAIPWDAILSIEKKKAHLRGKFWSEYDITPPDSDDFFVTGAKRDLLIRIAEILSPRFRKPQIHDKHTK